MNESILPTTLMSSLDYQKELEQRSIAAFLCHCSGFRDGYFDSIGTAFKGIESVCRGEIVRILSSGTDDIEGDLFGIESRFVKSGFSKKRRGDDNDADVLMSSQYFVGSDGYGAGDASVFEEWTTLGTYMSCCYCHKLMMNCSVPASCLCRYCTECANKIAGRRLACPRCGVTTFGGWRRDSNMEELIKSTKSLINDVTSQRSQAAMKEFQHAENELVADSENSDPHIKSRFMSAKSKMESIVPVIDYVELVENGGTGAPPPPYTTIPKLEFVGGKQKRGSENEEDIAICHCKRPRRNADGSRTLACTTRCVNRMLQIECSKDNCPAGSYCGNQRFQQELFYPCRVIRTEKKGCGLVSDFDIRRGDLIIDYVGEVVDTTECRRRLLEYGEGRPVYMMGFSAEEVVDATEKGKMSRFINHGCNPNAQTGKWTVNGIINVGVFALEDIPAGREITMDYQFQAFGRAVQKCYCGGASCRGYLGAKNPDYVRCCCERHEAANGELLIACNVCNMWIHGVCIGIEDSSQARQLDDYICRRCVGDTKQDDINGKSNVTNKKKTGFARFIIAEGSVAPPPSEFFEKLDKQLLDADLERRESKTSIGKSSSGLKDFTIKKSSSKSYMEDSEYQDRLGDSASMQRSVSNKYDLSELAATPSVPKKDLPQIVSTPVPISLDRSNSAGGSEREEPLDSRDSSRPRNLINWNELNSKSAAFQDVRYERSSSWLNQSTPSGPGWSSSGIAPIGIIGSSCYKCGNTGHLPRACPIAVANAQCYSCGLNGHFSRDCPNPALPPGGSGSGWGSGEWNGSEWDEPPQPPPKPCPSAVESIFSTALPSLGIFSIVHFLSRRSSVFDAPYIKSLLQHDPARKREVSRMTQEFVEPFSKEPTLMIIRCADDVMVRIYRNFHSNIYYFVKEDGYLYDLSDAILDGINNVYIPPPPSPAPVAVPVEIPCYSNQTNIPIVNPLSQNRHGSERWSDGSDNVDKNKGLSQKNSHRQSSKHKRAHRSSDKSKSSSKSGTSSHKKEKIFKHDVVKVVCKRLTGHLKRGWRVPKERFKAISRKITDKVVSAETSHGVFKMNSKIRDKLIKTVDGFVKKDRAIAKQKHKSKSKDTVEAGDDVGDGNVDNIVGVASVSDDVDHDGLPAESDDAIMMTADGDDGCSVSEGMEDSDDDGVNHDDNSSANGGMSTDDGDDDCDDDGGSDVIGVDSTARPEKMSES